MKNKNLVFLNEFDNQKIKLLIREAIKGNIQIFTLDNKNNFYQLSPSDVHHIYSSKPNQIQIFFRKPQYINNRMEDFGDWKNVSFDDLFIDENSAESLLNDFSKSPQKPVISKEQLHKKWQETANQVICDNPTWDKVSVAKEIFERLKNNDRSYLLKKDDTFYPIETIKRNFNMNKSHRK